MGVPDAVGEALSWARRLALLEGEAPGVSGAVCDADTVLLPLAVEVPEPVGALAWTAQALYARVGGAGDTARARGGAGGPRPCTWAWAAQCYHSASNMHGDTIASHTREEDALAPVWHVVL